MPTIHKCSVCGSEGEWWGSSWSWFGSDADLENGLPVLKFCSLECRAKGPAGEFTFDGHGEIEAVTTYRIHCGGCGEADELESPSRKEASREAEGIGWVKHVVGGWLCPKCASRILIYEKYQEAVS